MSYRRGVDRSQGQLLPPCLEDYVPSNSPVRFIDAFVETLDFKKLGFAHAEPAGTGRPPYHPADLLKLYLYGYLNRIRSSRRLEAEAGRNIELMWLLRLVQPDFKTIADFRAKNRASFKPLFKEFNLLCRKLELFGAELVAIDGSKFKAVNNPRHHLSQKLFKEMIEKVEERINEYLKDLDTADAEAAAVAAGPSRQELEQKISRLKEKREEYNNQLKEMQDQGITEVSLIDPDSRGMQKVGVGYNVQIAVDAKHHLIVEPEVVQSSSDRGQLSSMAIAAQKELGVDDLKVVADAGYHEATQLENCEKSKIETFVAEQGKTSGKNKEGDKIYPKEKFGYDAMNDHYRCPGGQILKHHHQSITRAGGKDRILYYNRQACKTCLLKNKCTVAKYRIIYRRPNEDVSERQAARLKANPEMMFRRREIVEHVFGTLRNWGNDEFLMRGLQKVRGEFSLSSLAYNLRRVLNIVTPEILMKNL